MHRGCNSPDAAPTPNVHNISRNTTSVHRTRVPASATLDVSHTRGEYKVNETLESVLRASNCIIPKVLYDRKLCLTAVTERGLCRFYTGPD